jgi:hypothetical protein
MDRRTYLRAVATGGTATMAGLAGCTGRLGDDGGPPVDGGPDPANATGEVVPPPAPRDVDLPVPESDLQRGAGEDDIPAITDPAFGADWGEVDASLTDTDRVIGVERAGEARAYPLAVLNWHEVVNDAFDGPLLVTYCPLCDSGLTARRTVAGEVATFGVSGLLYRSDLVMYDDRTDSLWSQILATAIRGSRTGDQLSLVPSAITTWGAWRTDHPDTRVLLPPPASGTIVDARPRPYDQNPYEGYDDSRRTGIGFGSGEFDDERLHPKTRVVGVTADGRSRAYPLDVVAETGPVNDRVGGLPVVVGAVDGTLYAYDRRLDGETLAFVAAGDRRVRAGGSTFRLVDGRAISGPHEGSRLRQASTSTSLFWFAWLEFRPDTDVYRP